MASSDQGGGDGDGDGGSFVVIIALLANIGIAIAKFIAAGISGSSAMLTEAFHSVVDTLNEVLLLYGRKRAKKPADEIHPLGYGRELYFWSFVVAILIFAIGAGLSVYEGVMHIRHPEPLADPRISFIVIGVGFLLEGTSWVIALRGFNRQRSETPLWRAIRVSKNPPGFIVLLEDSAALLGLLAAAMGIGAAVITGNPVYDGAASIFIGLLLGVVALVLARESKNLLIGERADPRLADAIRKTMEGRKEIAKVCDVMTIHLAPDQVVAAVSANFHDDVSVPDLEKAIRSAQQEIAARWPLVRRVYVTPEE
jgi:cation diffusion facilitator family transporter